VIRVLIADDHSAIRRGVRSILLSRQDIEVCGEAADGRDAIQRALTARPDLVIIDLTMPVMGGFEAARVLRKILPETAILFYSMHEEEQLIKDAKDLGVHGFVGKTEISGMLLEAVEAVIDKKTTYFPSRPKLGEVGLAAPKE
jgi:two-component system, NarL family, response regulator NreC